MALPPWHPTLETLSWDAHNCRVFVRSVPDESSASSPEDRDPGLFLLRKDSERRAILYKILWEEQNQVASNLQECVAQVGRGQGRS